MLSDPLAFRSRWLMWSRDGSWSCIPPACGQSDGIAPACSCDDHGVARVFHDEPEDLLPAKADKAPSLVSRQNALSAPFAWASR